MGGEASQQVVITGVGPVTPIGIGRDAFWDSLITGRSGVTTREPFADDIDSPFRLISPITYFTPREYITNRKALKVMCREIQIGCAAATLAINDAGIDAGSLDPDRVGVITGTESFYTPPEDMRDVYVRYRDGGTVDGADEDADVNAADYGRWIESALREIQPLWMLKYLPNMVSCQIAIAIDARGPNNSIFQGAASSLLAVIEASELIRRGVADVMIVGGSGSQMGLANMMYTGVDQLCTGEHDPSRAIRPFDRNRNGTVCGEGAGMLVLESRSHAEKRGATVLANLPATASTCQTTSSDEQDAIFRALKLVGEKVEPSTSGQMSIFASADGRTEGDRVEASALSRYCDSAATHTVTAPNVTAPIITAPAGQYGDVGTGTAAINLIAAVLSLVHQQIPATPNFETADIAATSLDIVHGNRRETDCTISLVTASSQTGQAAAIALANVQES